MSYQIVYGKKNNWKRFIKRNQKILIPIMVAIIALVSVIFSKQIFPALIPGDPEVTAAALTNLVDNLRDGISVYDAVETFCRDVIIGAGIYG